MSLTLPRLDEIRIVASASCKRGKIEVVEPNGQRLHKYWVRMLGRQYMHLSTQMIWGKAARENIRVLVFVRPEEYAGRNHLELKRFVRSNLLSIMSRQHFNQEDNKKGNTE